MARERQRPTRTDGSRVYDYKEQHPAYAMIVASRVSASPPGHSLFGSDFRHQHFVTITIRKAELARGLANDSYFANKELIEVALSEAQWATFVSAMNQGHGVPCTLEWLTGDGMVPGIIQDSDRRTQFNQEVSDDLRESISLMEEALAEAKTKTQREKIERAISRLRSGLPFVAAQFDEHAEKTIESMKIEINAYLTASVTQRGLEALGAKPMLTLNDGDDS